MTKLLDEAVQQLCDLPEEEQDAAADLLFIYIASDEREYHLQPHQVTQVRRAHRRLLKKTTRLATDAEVKSVRQKFRS